MGDNRYIPILFTITTQWCLELIGKFVGRAFENDYL